MMTLTNVNYYRRRKNKVRPGEDVNKKVKGKK